MSPRLGYGLDATPGAWEGSDPSMPRELSASQVGLFTDCQRKWGFRYLEGFKEIGQANLLGTRIHEILEEYQKKGTPPNRAETFWLAHRYKTNLDGSPALVQYWPGQIAESGLYLLPPPGVVSVEDSFHVRTPSGQSWQGRKDGRYVRGPTGEALPIGPPGDGLVIVQDHKSTSDKKWALHEGREAPGPGEEDNRLLTDLQANLYAWDEMARLGISWVGVEWIYYLTSGPKREAWPVRQLLGGQQVADVIGHADEIAHQVQEVYTAKPPVLELTPNPKMCEAYGGCPHRGVCNLTATQMIGGLLQMESIKELMERKKREREALASGAVPPVVPPPVPQAPEAPAFQPGAPPPLPPGMVPVVQNVQPPERVTVYAAPPAAAPMMMWKPGDPMNPAQGYLRGQGKPWSVVASAADGPNIPEEVRMAYDSAFGPNGEPLAPLVDRQHINPPEAPPIAPAHVGQMPAPPAAPQETVIQDDLTHLDREVLKKAAVTMGVVDASSRLGDKALREAIRAARAAGKAPAAPVMAVVAGAPIAAGQMVVTPAAPPPLPPGMVGYIPPQPAAGPVPVVANAMVQTPAGPVHVNIPPPAAKPTMDPAEWDILVNATMAALPAALSLTQGPEEAALVAVETAKHVVRQLRERADNVQDWE